jgi:gas vesicle protein
MNTAVKVIGGFLAGAAIGTVTGILIAPDKGKNTRKKLKDESTRLANQLSESVSNSIHALKDDYNRKLDEYAENGKSSIDTVKSKMKV